MAAIPAAILRRQRVPGGVVWPWNWLGLSNGSPATCSRMSWQIGSLGRNTKAQEPRLAISSVSFPANPACTVGAVKCTRMPHLAHELFPSILAARVGFPVIRGSATYSTVWPRINAPRSSVYDPDLAKSMCSQLCARNSAIFPFFKSKAYAPLFGIDTFGASRKSTDVVP